MSIGPFGLPKGWTSWENRRRAELRKTMSLSDARHFALYERRCRSAIGLLIGNPKAKALRLATCVTEEHFEPRFVLLTKVDAKTWTLLDEVPYLARQLRHRP